MLTYMALWLREFISNQKDAGSFPFLYIVFLQEAFWHFTEIFSHFAYWPVEYSFIVQSIAVPHKGSQWALFIKWPDFGALPG